MDDRIQVWDFGGLTGLSFQEYYGRPIVVEDPESDESEEGSGEEGGDMDACDSLSD